MNVTWGLVGFHDAALHVCGNEIDRFQALQFFLSKRYHDLTCRTLTVVGACARLTSSCHVPTGFFMRRVLFAQDQVATSRWRK